MVWMEEWCLESVKAHVLWEVGLGGSAWQEPFVLFLLLFVLYIS